MHLLELFIQNSGTLIEKIIDDIVPTSEIAFKKEVFKIMLSASKISHPTELLGFSNDLIENKLPEIDLNIPDFFSNPLYQMWFQQINRQFLKAIADEILTNSEMSRIEKKEALNLIVNQIKDAAFENPMVADQSNNQAFIEYLERNSKYLGIPLDQIPPTTISYWPFEMSKLAILESLLLQASLIERNSFFEECFNYSKKNKKERTIWLGKQQELFALLYLIFSKSDYYLNERISVISWKLFNVKKVKEDMNNTNRAFTKFMNKIHQDQDYIYNKHIEIFDIFDELGI